MQALLRLAGAIIALVLWRYLITAVILRRRLRLPAEWDVRMADPGVVPPAVTKFFMAVRADLAALGFTPVAELEVRGRRQLRIALCERSDVHDVAMLVTVRDPKKRERFLEFTSRFADGREVVTNQIDRGGVFPKVPTRRITSLPDVTETARLYQLHRAIVASQPAGERAPRCPIGDPVEVVKDTYRRSLEQQIQTGYLWRAGAHYRPTWKGACLMRWRGLWPWKQRLHWARRREQARLLAAVPAESAPPPPAEPRASDAS